MSKKWSFGFVNFRAKTKRQFSRSLFPAEMPSVNHPACRDNAGWVREPRPDKEMDPLRRLAASVLDRAVLDALGDVAALSEECRAGVKREANLWLQDLDAIRLWCEILGVEPEAFRSSFYKLQKNPEMRRRSDVRNSYTGLKSWSVPDGIGWVKKIA